MEDGLKSEPVDQVGRAILEEPVDQVDRPILEEPVFEGTNAEILRRHNITFSFLDSGCTISVGCRTYAFSNKEEGLGEFIEFVQNPKEAWKKWNN